MKRAVLFDCDGVLVNSEEGLAKIAAYVLNHYFNIPAVPEDFAQYIGTGEDSYIGGVVRKYGREYIYEMKNKIYEEYGRLAAEYVPSVAGGRELIGALRRQGYKVALASSADQTKVDINLKILGMDRKDFDAVLSGSDVAKKKPDPDIYLTAASYCHIEPCDCIVVEDATSGVQSGKSAGMTVIGIPSSVPPEILRSFGADHIAETMEKLDEVIHAID